MKSVLDICKTTKEKGCDKLKRNVHYKQGYKIIIRGKFYKVIDGNRVLHFGELKHKPTLQEVWNKTIGGKEKEFDEKHRFKTNNKIHCTTNYH